MWRNYRSSKHSHRIDSRLGENIMSKTYEANWKSLRTHPTPEWFKNDKFGIYTHWGIYSVPAYGPNGTWYPNAIYRQKGKQYEHHVKTYGPLSEFGYKDFIPMFTGEKFDADEWAELFKKAGARFAGPVAIHHDGFAMWDTKYTEWNAAKMGPKRDVVGEQAAAFSRQGMRFLTAFHHAANWWFFPHWYPELDTADPQYSGLYGPLHNQDASPELGWQEQDKPSKEFLDQWKGMILEVVDKYEPDMLWFDFALGMIQEHYRKEFLAYYYNKEKEWNKDVVVTYKFHNMPPGTAVIDLEVGRMAELTIHDWITDTSVDDSAAWSYVKDAKFKSMNRLVDNLVDRVSKNGYLLLNVGPKPNGEIPEPAKERLLGIGKWLEVNGEAIYDTTPWTSYGEGPTKMEKGGSFTEKDEVEYTAKDIRFTVKDDFLYATCLDWPGEQMTIESLKGLYEEGIKSVRMLGVDKDLEWSMTGEGLKITPPDEKPCEHAYVFKIARQRPW